MRIIVILLTVITGTTGFQDTDRFSAARKRMVEEQIAARGIRNSDVLRAMEKVPRHLFVPREYQADAYKDYPMPIGYGQTISQPYIVAIMTEAGKPDRSKKVLEVGTGSGYQAAVIAEIVKEVYTIEIVPELAEESAERLRELGYTNVICKYGDGYNGWKEHAPFDIILVTAAPESIPPPLIEQLAEGGRMIIPLGKQSGVQELMIFSRKNGKTESKRISFVRFVPFRRL